MNIVGVIDFNEVINLENVRIRISKAKKLRRLPWLRIRLRNSIVALVYPTKAIVLGVKNIEELHNIAKELISVLEKANIKASIRRVRVENISVTLSLGVRISLNKAARVLNGAYDPEYRPFVITYIDNATVMIFESGKVNILGLKSLNQAVNIVNKLREVIPLIRK